ncbi:hypothetical protein EYC80_004998 [Monilinia laxa]|uniref:Uncharacterized protein n=1 Tax=Monilinia laxa TaxID=61186 RepID=A0A5N6KK87_MONLA|nr:hypothetical protein EYC80_004998 [Monilinia laxa]
MLLQNYAVPECEVFAIGIGLYASPRQPSTTHRLIYSRLFQCPLPLIMPTPPVLPIKYSIPTKGSIRPN